MPVAARREFGAPIHSSPLLVEKSSWSVNDVDSGGQCGRTSHTSLLQAYIAQHDQESNKTSQLQSSAQGSSSSSRHFSSSLAASLNRPTSTTCSRRSFSSSLSRSHQERRPVESTAGTCRRQYAYDILQNSSETGSRQGLAEVLRQQSPKSDLEIYLKNQSQDTKPPLHADSSSSFQVRSKSISTLDADAYNSPWTSRTRVMPGSSTRIHGDLQQSRRFPSAHYIVSDTQNLRAQSMGSCHKSLDEFLQLEKQCSTSSSQETLKSVEHLEDEPHIQESKIVVKSEPPSEKTKTASSVMENANSVSENLRERLKTASLLEKKLLTTEERRLIRDDIMRKQCNLEDEENKTPVFAERGFLPYNTNRLNELLNETRRLLDTTNKNAFPSTFQPQSAKGSGFSESTKSQTANTGKPNDVDRKLDDNLSDLRMMLKKYAKQDSYN